MDAIPFVDELVKEYLLFRGYVKVVIIYGACPSVVLLLRHSAME
jgi:hypothetical protein